MTPIFGKGGGDMTMMMMTKQQQSAVDATGIEEVSGKRGEGGKTTAGEGSVKDARWAAAAAAASLRKPLVAARRQRRQNGGNSLAAAATIDSRAADSMTTGRRQ